MILEFILKIQRELLLTTESLPKNYGESLSEKLYQTAHIRNAFAVAFSTIASLGIQQRLTSKSCTCTLIISHLVKYFWSTQVTFPMSVTTAEKKLSVSSQCLTERSLRRLPSSASFLMLLPHLALILTLSMLCFTVRAMFAFVLLLKNSSTSSPFSSVASCKDDPPCVRKLCKSGGDVCVKKKSYES
jgi:hypothetical protein